MNNYEMQKVIKDYLEEISGHEETINTYYINFKTTIDYYDKEYMIDKNGILCLLRFYGFFKLL